MIELFPTKDHNKKNNSTPAKVSSGVRRCDLPELKKETVAEEAVLTVFCVCCSAGCAPQGIIKSSGMIQHTATSGKYAANVVREESFRPIRTYRDFTPDEVLFLIVEAKHYFHILFLNSNITTYLHPGSPGTVASARTGGLRELL